MKRVLLADGCPITRRGYRSVLEKEADLYVVGECGTGEKALLCIEELRPVLVILGLNLVGELDGTRTCQRIKNLSEPPRILIYASCNERGDARSCYLAGGDSFLHKRVSCEHFLEAVRLTLIGERIWEPSKSLGHLTTRINIRSEAESLTLRQQEVLTLRLRGHTRSRIAEELSISINTVKFHLRNLSRTLGNVERFR